VPPTPSRYQEHPILSFLNEREPGPRVEAGVLIRYTDERLEVATVDALDTDARNTPVQRRRARARRRLVVRRKPVEVVRNKPVVAERRTPFAVRERCRQ
jgi:hypothetical protein